MSNAGKGVRIQMPIERVNKQLADIANVKPTKFFQIESLLNNASEEIKRKLLAETIKPHFP
jgi:hypothetical protein